MNVISAFYYLKIIKVLYFEENSVDYSLGTYSLIKATSEDHLKIGFFWGNFKKNVESFLFLFFLGISIIPWNYYIEPYWFTSKLVTFLTALI